MTEETVKKINNPARITLDEHHEWALTTCPATKKKTEIMIVTPLKPKGTRIIGIPKECGTRNCSMKTNAACLLRCSKISARRQN